MLDYFKVEDPELITDVGAQLKDISIRKTAGDVYKRQEQGREGFPD